MAGLKFSSPEIAARVEEWTSPKFDAATRAEVQALVDAGEVAELEDRFYRTLEFGTGGLRGLMGAGTNRMNPTVVACASQGLAAYVKAHADTSKGPLRAAVTHDCRNNSEAYARAIAEVFAANGFIVHLSPELRPTPWLSFAVRHLGCHTAVNLTASHNPKEYSGYKVYWDDGSQVVPPHDKGIIAEVEKVAGIDQVRRMDFDEAVAKGLVLVTGDDLDDAYIDAVCRQRLDAEALRSHPVKAVFTPLHGVGGRIAPKAFAKWGIADVLFEPEQMKPDGNFPTAASPNPEEGAALGRAIEMAEREGADLVLATDPDADRLGIAVRHAGQFRLVTGNQLSCVLGEYILSRQKALGRAPARPGVVSTIVTTPLLSEIAAHHGADYADVLTGFKWIAQAMRDWIAAGGATTFVYGTEESYGYMIGDHCRDKDGIVAACATAEAASWAKSQGKTLIDVLHDLYLRHEPRLEWQKSVTLKGREGAEKIKALMEALKASPPKEFAGVAVATATRIDTGVVLDGATGEPVGRVSLPPSNVVVFDLADGSKIVARPSGTEPKVKFYFFLADEKQSTPEGVKQALDKLEARKEGFQAAFLEAVGMG